MSSRSGSVASGTLAFKEVFRVLERRRLVTGASLVTVRESSAFSRVEMSLVEGSVLTVW